MTEQVIIRCDSCGRQLRVPRQNLGRIGKCPACGSRFRAEESGARLPSEADKGVLREAVSLLKDEITRKASAGAGESQAQTSDGFTPRVLATFVPDSLSPSGKYELFDPGLDVSGLPQDVRSAIERETLNCRDSQEAFETMQRIAPVLDPHLQNPLVACIWGQMADLATFWEIAEKMFYLICDPFSPLMATLAEETRMRFSRVVKAAAEQQAARRKTLEEFLEGDDSRLYSELKMTFKCLVRADLLTGSSNAQWRTKGVEILRRFEPAKLPADLARVWQEMMAR